MKCRSQKSPGSSLNPRSQVRSISIPHISSTISVNSAVANHYSFPATLPLAVTQPHVTPAAAQKTKGKRAKSATALKRKAKALEKGMEIAQKLDKRRGSVDGKKDQKKRAKALWE